MSVVRLCLRLLFFISHLLAGALISLLFLILLKRKWYNFAIGKQTVMFWMKGLILILGVRIKSTGTCVTAPALLVSNHISWLDVMVLGSQCPTAFLAKSEVRHWPLIGFLAAISGTLFVDRDSKMAIGDARERIQDTLNAGRSVTIFPEGTTTDGEDIKPFKSSFYQSAVESGVVVQAIGLRYFGVDGVKSHAPYIDNDVFFVHLLKVLKAPYTKVSLSFCEPVNYKENYSRKMLAKMTYDQIRLVLEISPILAE